MSNACWGESRKDGIKLRQSEDRYRFLANAIPGIAVLLFDRNFRYLVSAGAALKTAGFDPEKIEGLTLQEAFPPAVVDLFKPLYTKALAGIPSSFELPYENSVFSQQVLPICDEHGEVYAGLVVAQDITDRVKTERQLQSIINYTENILQTANAIIVQLDIGGQVIRLNTAAEKILGYSFSELKGKNWFETICPKELYPDVWAEFTRLCAGGTPKHFENPVRTKSQQERHIAWQNSEVCEDGVIQGLICFGLDVTEERRALEKLESMQREAEGASIAKGRFIANMSHEIRTPLNGIIGATSLLSMGPLNSQQQRLVDVINSSSEVLLRVINDILDVSKIESKTLELETSEFEIEAFLTEITNTYTTVLANRSVTFCCEKGAGLPATFHGDRVRIMQILMNLLNNAIKFTEKGIITLSAFGCEHSGKRGICFTVRDTGAGMSKENVSKLFRRFFQASQSSHTNHNGTGLGLVIVRELVELMNGSIEVESEIGKGTTFHAFLPFKD
jgi:PAS domain S-box-containing protein